ncbi:MAG: response regulator [Bacteroidales bacterium]|nr:response regulator [Bacteroidales bacterium]
MKLRISLLCLLFFPLFGFGIPDNLKFRHLNTENGLPNNVVFSIYEDKDGFMWFGTDDGLCRYDGYEIKSFHSDINNPNSISGNTIFDIDEDQEGNLWVCTSEGVDIFDRDLRQFRHLVFRDANNVLDTMRPSIDFFQDKQNNIFISTKNEVFVFNPQDQVLDQVYIPLDFYDKFQSEYKLFGFIDSQNRIWMAAQNDRLSMFCYDRNSETLISNPYEPDIFGIQGTPQTIAEQPGGDIWIGTDQGVYIIKSDLSETKEIELGEVITYSISFDNMGHAMIATEPRGLFVYNLKAGTLCRYQHLKHDKFSISSNKVLKAKTDSRGILWIGTTQSGISYANTVPSKQFINVIPQEDNPNSISYPTVSAIFEDRDGDLWIGTDGGGLDLQHVNTGMYSHFTYQPGMKNSLGSNSVLSITQTPDGTIWVGGYLMGVNAIDKKTGEIKIYKHDPGNPNTLSNDDVRKVYADKEGILWIATCGGGLNRLDPATGKFTVYQDNVPNGIVGIWCLTLFEDSRDLLWIGTYNGLSYLDRETGIFTNFNHSQASGSLSNDWIYAIIEDPDSNIWIGTSKGLNAFNRKTQTFTSYFETDGLPNNCINDIQTDSEGMLWLSTNKGISKFIREEKVFRNYDISDGLFGNQFFRSASFKNKDGMIFFGGYQGYTCFFPDSIRDDTHFPPVFITDLLIFHSIVNPGEKGSPLKKSITESDQIVLAHNHSVITLRYAALNFSSSRKVEYAYYMEGFSNKWDYVGDRREVTFTNLDPGTYTFKVKASNADGIWNDNYKSIRIVITPPYWKTWWFRLGLVVIIVGAVLTLYFMKVRSIRHQNNRLEKIVRERTSELSEKNENLIMTKELLEEKQHEIITQNEELSDHRNNLERLVSERTAELESALKKARESDELKSAFLANMSHEIRTPMNAIVGFSALLNQDALSPQERLNYTEIIQSNSETLLKIIDEILDISLIEANQLRLTKTTFHLNSVLDHLYSYYYLEKNSEQLEIRKNNELHDFNLKLNTDSARFRQIITNLMDNASKFTQSGYIELGCRKEGDDLCFYVEDSGKGISAEDLELIFDRFRKATDSSSFFTRGVGLGLAISQKIARNLGGRLEVKSVPGQGSVFTFRIPFETIATEGDVSMMEVKESIATRWDNKTILIAEDEEANYLFLEKILNKTNTRILWAKNGLEAVKIVKEHRKINLVLMDIKMPEMNGYEAATQIKKHHPELPIIAQTAYARPEERLKYADANFDDYIPKPINAYNLLLVLERYL